RGKEVAATVQSKDIPTLVRGLLEEIDGARHESEHRVVRTRPPVSVALCAFVARERHRRQLVDDDHSPDTLTYGQVIRRRESGDSRAADDDVGRVGHPPNNATPRRGWARNDVR